MPQNCFACACASYYGRIDRAMCDLTNKQLDIKVWKKERHPDCPLIELPPHGRLIAEKTITEIRYHDADGYHIVNGEQLCELEIDAETVIEAEGETDGR